MSVIFKTLKKLKSGQAPDNKRGLKGKRIYSFRKKILSPLFVFLFVFSVFIIGFGALYGVDNITNYIKSKRLAQLPPAENIHAHNQKNKTADTSNVEAHKPQEIQLKAPDQPKAGDTPPPPDSIPYEKPEPGRIYLRTGHTKKPFKKIQTGARDIVRYIPSKQSETFKIKSKDIQQRNKKPPALPAEKRHSITPPALPNKISGNRTTTSQVTFLPKTNEKTGIFPAALPAPSATKENDIQNKFPQINKQPDARKMTKSNTTASGVEFLPEKHKTTEKPAFIPVDKQPDQYRVASVRKKNKSKENFHLADIEKCSEISRLVTKIKKSMTMADNVHETKSLIDQLAKLKGENNNYILKLKAFCYIQNDDYEAAAGLLKKVLDKNSADLNAGINMAVIEIKNNRLQKAYNRLSKLKEVYPDNILIPEILQKLAQ